MVHTSGNEFPSVTYDFNPNSLPDGYLRAIGLVISCASQTEEIMREFLGALLGVDNIETIALGTHMSAPMKDDVIRAIVELNAPSASELDNIDDILDRIGEGISKRNAIAHSAFAIHPDSGEIFRLKEKARGSVQADFQPITIEELTSIADEIYEAGMSLQEFMASRSLAPKLRTKQLREPIKRSKKARADRRQQYGENY